MTRKILFIALLAVATIACKKEHDSENPVITIYTPTAGQEFESSDSVTINFKAEDVDLHEVGFSITKTSDSSVLYNSPAAHTHNNPLVINKKFKMVVTVDTEATLIVNAEDHNGNTASKSVNFHIHAL